MHESRARSRCLLPTVELASVTRQCGSRGLSEGVGALKFRETFKRFFALPVSYAWHADFFFHGREEEIILIMRRKQRLSWLLCSGSRWCRRMRFSKERTFRTAANTNLKAVAAPGVRYYRFSVPDLRIRTLSVSIPRFYFPEVFL